MADVAINALSVDFSAKDVIMVEPSMIVVSAARDTVVMAFKRADAKFAIPITSAVMARSNMNVLYAMNVLEHDLRRNVRHHVSMDGSSINALNVEHTVFTVVGQPIAVTAMDHHFVIMGVCATIVKNVVEPAFVFMDGGSVNVLNVGAMVFASTTIKDICAAVAIHSSAMWKVASVNIERLGVLKI